MRQRHAALLIALSLGMMTGCGQVGTPLSVNEAAEAQAERAYSIIDMQGIGPVYAEKLKTAGLSNTNKFLAATADRKGRMAVAETTGIPYKNVLHWARKAELMRIPGIGVKQADLLEAVGVDSVKELAQRVPANLAERVGIANNISRKFVKTTPSEATVTKWVQAAKDLAQPGKALDE